MSSAMTTAIDHTHPPRERSTSSWTILTSDLRFHLSVKPTVSLYHLSLIFSLSLTQLSTLHLLSFSPFRYSH